MIYKIYHDFSGVIYILVPRVLRTLGTNKGGGGSKFDYYSLATPKKLINGIILNFAVFQAIITILAG